MPSNRIGLGWIIACKAAYSGIAFAAIVYSFYSAVLP